MTISYQRPRRRLKNLAVGATAAAGGLGTLVGLTATYIARTHSAPKRPALDYGFTPFELDIPWADMHFDAADGARRQHARRHDQLDEPRRDVGRRRRRLDDARHAGQE